MATLSPSGRIDSAAVVLEAGRLARLWSRAGPEASSLGELLGNERLAELDAFDRVQLEYVVSVCGQCASLSEAGRQLFAASRKQRSSTNDADRLRKYLAKFGLDWAAIAADWRTSGR
jgi:transcriptional regulatory protein RtcR